MMIAKGKPRESQEEAKRRPRTMGLLVDLITYKIN